MPIDVFDAISGNLSSFLGGATVHLVPEGEKETVEKGIIQSVVSFDGLPHRFVARRDALPFSRSEEAFCRELMTAFAAMYTGFRQEGYAAHFRTALLASIMDIAVARWLRGDHRKGFWPIQQLVQLLKSLSYQRYEGKPATTGFIVHRTTLKGFKKIASERQHRLDLLKPYEEVSPNFFENPLTYRFIDGANLFFVANIQMQVTGVLRTFPLAVQTDIERLTQREIFSLVRRAGRGAFAITVNEASEIEVLTSPAKLLVRRRGAWSIFDPDLFRSFLAGSIDDESIDELLWTVYALSKFRHGTVILIYDGGRRRLAPLKKGSVGGDDPLGRLLISRVKGRKIADLKQSGTLLRILSSDGMTIFSRSGKLLETGFIIDTSHAREVVTGGGRTTAASAASLFGKVIKVSQDGPIELYREGHRIYRFG